MSKKPEPEYDFSERFVQRMKHAMWVSHHKYGRLRDAYPHKVNAVACIRQRLKLYEETGNADYLTDVANFAMIETMFPAHPEHHYAPTDGGEGRKWHAGGPASEATNVGDRR